MAYGKRGTPGRRVKDEDVKSLVEQNLDENLAVAALLRDESGVEEKKLDLGFLTEFRYQGKKLRPRELLFVSEYLLDYDATRAFLASSPGVKPAVCNRAQAKATLDRPHVQAAVAACIEQRLQILSVNHRQVLNELAKLAFSNLTDVVEWNGTKLSMKNMEDVPDNAKAAISEITETRGPNGTTFKVKMHDKNPALNNLMRHLGLYEDKVTIKHEVDVVDALREARERAEKRREKSVAGDRVFDEQGKLVDGKKLQATN